MRGLFFKVFIIFWIAQSLIFVISTALIVRHHFDEIPDALFDALLQQPPERREQEPLLLTKRAVATPCMPMDRVLAQTIALEDASGQDLCKPPARARQRQPCPDAHAHHRQPGRSAIYLESSCYLSKRESVRVSAEPAPCSKEHHLVPGPSAFLVPATSCGHRRRRTHNIRACLALYPSGSAAQKSRPRAGNGKPACPRRLAHIHKSRIFAEDEIHALMHDFNHMAERLESLVDAQKLLLRDVSHELRSPLVPAQRRARTGSRGCGSSHDAASGPDRTGDGAAQSRSLANC